MKNATDGELMQAIAKGSSSAFAELFARHGGLVLGYGRRLVKEQSLAEDVAQEVWIKVVKAAADYNEQGAYRSWLLKIVRHTALNVLRSRIRIDSSDPIEDNSAVLSKEEFESVFSRQQEVERVKQMIAELPEQQRVVLMIWLNEDVSYDEIADMLNISVSAVKSLLFRARRNLEQQLGGGQ